MKGKGTLIAVLVAGLLLGLAVGMNQAQEPAAGEDTSAGGARSLGGALVQPGEGQAPDPTLGTWPEGAVSSIVPIQGRLTDARGNPLDGNHLVRARIYDVSTGGTALCDDTDVVAVEDGLFNMDMDGCTSSHIDGEQLYLGMAVDTDAEMTPRQGIYPVPYAWTVKPGAVIRGGTTYLYTPGTAFVKNNSTDSTRWLAWGGAPKIYQGGGTPGLRHIRFPITVPSVLYGREVRVTSVRVDYLCEDGSDNYIADTQLYKHLDADSFVSVVVDSTPRTSNSATSYSLATDPNYSTLSATTGSLTLRLGLYFANDAEYIQVSGVRLTLVTDY